MNRRIALIAIVTLAVVGIVIAAYQSVEHYTQGPALCDLSETFSCSLVTESQYGEFPPRSGIATALWGVAWWAGLLAVAPWALRAKSPVAGNRRTYLFLYVLAGLLFVFYLLFVELYLLPLETGVLALCPFCTVQHVFILALVPLAYLTLGKPLGKALSDVFLREEE